MVVLDEVISEVPATWVKCPCYLLGDNLLPVHLQQDASGQWFMALTQPCGDCLGHSRSSRKGRDGRTEWGGERSDPKELFQQLFA